MKNIRVSYHIAETNSMKEILFTVSICALFRKAFADWKVAEKEVANERMLYCSAFIEDV